MTKLQRMRTRQALNERQRQAQKLADVTGQPQVVVRDPVNNVPRILPAAIRSSQPGGTTLYPRRKR